MRSKRAFVVVAGVGAALLAGCGAEQPGEETSEGVLPEAVQAEAGPGERELTEAVLPAYCNDVLTWPRDAADLEYQVLTLVNQKRAAGATCGGVYKPPVPALTLNENLRCAARKHSKDMALNNFMSHTGSNGSTFTQRITSAGYAWKTAGENIAAGYTTASAVMSGWMASTGHCNNIMNPAFKHLGVGYSYSSASTYKAYWTQNFGAQ